MVKNALEALTVMRSQELPVYTMRYYSFLCYLYVGIISFIFQLAQRSHGILIPDGTFQQCGISLTMK